MASKQNMSQPNTYQPPPNYDQDRATWDKRTQTTQHPSILESHLEREVNWLKNLVLLLIVLQIIFIIVVLV